MIPFAGLPPDCCYNTSTITALSSFDCIIYHKQKYRQRQYFTLRSISFRCALFVSYFVRKECFTACFSFNRVIIFVGILMIIADSDMGYDGVGSSKNSFFVILIKLIVRSIYLLILVLSHFCLYLV